MRWYEKTLKTKELPDLCDEAREITKGLYECTRKAFCAEQLQYGFTRKYCTRELAREHIQEKKDEEA